MGLFALVGWIAEWLLLRHAIYGDQGLTFLGWPSLAAIFGIIFLCFFFLINRNRIVSLILDLLIFGAYIFIMPKDIYVALGGVIFLIFLLLFEYRLAREEKGRADFSIRRVMSGSITLTVYGLLLLVGLNVYYSTLVDFKANPEAYYDRLEVVVAKNAQRFVQPSDQIVPEVVAAQTVDRIKESVKGYERYFPAIFTLIVTGTLLTFAFLVRWAAMIVGWLVFRLLVMTGFFKLHRVPVEVEKLEV